MRTLFPFLAVLALCACHQHQPAAFAGSSVSVAFVNGTVAPLGSFEWGVAPLQTEIRRRSDLGYVQMLKGEITANESQRQHDKLQNALNLVGRAIVACKQDNKTGHCTGDQKGADELVKQAQESMP